MSEPLDLLTPLFEIANNAPSNSTGVAASIWDDLLEQIRKAVSTIISGVIEPVKEKVTSISDSLTSSFNNTIQTVSNAVNTAKTSITNFVQTQVSNAVSSVKGFVEDVKTGINETLGNIGDAISDALGWIKDKLSGVIDSIRDIGKTISNSISDALRGLRDNIKQAINDALEGIGDFLSGVVGAVGDWITSSIESIKNTIAGVVNNVKEWIGNTYNTIKESIVSVIDEVKATYERVKKSLEDIINEAVTIAKLVIDRVVAWWHNTLGNVASWLSTEVWPKFETAIEGAKSLVELSKSLWGMIADGDYQKAFDTLDAFAKGLNIPAPIATLHAVLSTIAYFWQTIELQFVPLQVAAAKQANINLALEPISLDVAAQAVYREEMSLSEYRHNASLGGIANDRANKALQASRPLPSPGKVQEGFLRGQIDEKEHDRLLADYGYSPDNIELLKSLYHLIPPPSDLIRMAVRETFTPEVAEKFGQFEDFPEVFATWAERQGISKTWAERYWAAHWDLPSPSMGFEMLHRRIIDNDELKLLLRALDVMPYWRERLIELSYNPITRVDLRRMYKMGVLTAEEVYNGYLDIGYSPENAQRLTEFTKRYSAPEDQSQIDQFRELARTTYSQAYRKKIIAREEYTAYLVEMGYHPDDITLLIQLDDYAIMDKDKLFDLSDYRKDMLKLSLSAYSQGLITQEDIRSILTDLEYDDGEITLELSLVDYNRQLKIRDVLIDKIHTQYVEFIIENTDVHSTLSAYNFTSGEIDTLMEEWEIERSYRTKRPTLSDLRKFLTQGLITMEEFLIELRGLGFHEKYINLYQASLSKG